MIELRYDGEVIGWATFLPYELAVTFEPANEDETVKHQAIARHLALLAA